MTHEFTAQILTILSKHFDKMAQSVFDASPLLKYLNVKTRSASRGSKSRGSFGSIYPLYVLNEDYLAKGFDKNNGYKDYEGARFKPLLDRARELPFGAKLQNHAFNNRVNAEFEKHNPDDDREPIEHDKLGPLFGAI